MFAADPDPVAADPFRRIIELIASQYEYLNRAVAESCAERTAYYWVQSGFLRFSLEEGPGAEQAASDFVKYRSVHQRPDTQFELQTCKDRCLTLASATGIAFSDVDHVLRESIDLHERYRLADVFWPMRTDDLPIQAATEGPRRILHVLLVEKNRCWAVFDRLRNYSAYVQGRGLFPQVEKSARQDVGGDAEPPKHDSALSTRREEVLQALEQLKAVDVHSRKTTEQIAGKIERGLSGETIKAVVSALKKDGFVETKKGSQGGCWLTPKGIAKCLEISERDVQR